mgnify:CR=1 FL=1
MGLVSVSFGVAYAATPHHAQTQGDGSSNPLIDSLLFESSRFSQPEDDRLVDVEDYIEITRRDEEVLENDHFILYLNEDTLGMKILNKSNNYVWSTVVDDAEAGTYTELLSSTIGFEYIDLTQNFNLRQNIGITDTQFNYDMTQDGNTLKFDVNLDGFCTTRNCRRFYDRYLQGELTLEEMFEFGYRELGLGFSFEVTLTDEGIDFYLPVESIVEEDSDVYQLSSIIVFPGMGATYLDDIPGYMMIPDGAGALIRYEDNQRQFITPYQASYYGVDFGVDDSQSALNTYRLSMPIFGAVHGVRQNAFLGVIKSGATSANLFAFPNGARNVDYNLIYNRFDFKRVYRQSFTTDGSASALRIYESSFEDIEISYQFLNDDDADYVGMARAYQQYLVDDGILESMQTDANMIPIHFQFLMADSKNRFIGKELIEMTSVEDLNMMYQYFIDQGLSHQRVSLLGWNDGGYSGHLPSNVDFENQLGRNRDYEDFIELVESTNELLLLNNYMSGASESYGLNYGQDVAEAIDRFKLEWTSEFRVYNENYLLYPEFSRARAFDDFADYQDLGVDVLFQGIGSHVFSYYDDRIFTRHEALAIYQEIIDRYQGFAQYISPNAYAFKGMSAYYHMPLYNNQYNYFDDLVPILPIVLSGYMEMFSDQLNYNSLDRILLLRLVEYNVYPTYGLTKARPSKLAGTDIEYFYSSEFDAWKETIVEEYEWINQALSHVQGEEIISRDVPQLGVVVVGYSNGVEIIVNYTNESIMYDGLSVQAQAYLVRGDGNV